MKVKKSKILGAIFSFVLILILSLLGVVFFSGQNINGDMALAITENEVIEVEANNAEDIDELFEDFTATKLRDKYNDIDILNGMKNEIGEDVYNRAKDVLEGKAKYEEKRLFSTEFKDRNKIDQVGDIANYSTSVLNCIWKSSELILTGIYGLSGDTIKVFVKAESGAQLPSLILSQNHGYYYVSTWQKSYQLQLGMNVIKYPDIVTGSSYIKNDEVRGGAIYLTNPYDESQGRVDVYIDGGGYYPVLTKDGDENQFLSLLKEYEDERAKNSLMVDMAELVMDHAIITTTSSSLYDVYFNFKPITPHENIMLWDNYFTQLFEFNGIPTSPNSPLGEYYDERNDYVKINLRYMTIYPNSGAYSYTYHIGFYYEHYWFAYYYNAINPLPGHTTITHDLFGIGHEFGHALDNEPRKINETTNNLTASFAYFYILRMQHFEQYQPFEKTVKALSNDYTLNYRAYDDGKVMYTASDNYDHNYMIWWDLEAIFPGYWAQLNHYFRQPNTTGLNSLERYVYYSSLVTKVDLSDYFERWGFYYGKESSNIKYRFIYENASTNFKDLMNQATQSGEIEKKFDHFFYVDGEEYDFIRNNLNATESEKSYASVKPEISKINKNGSERTIYINSDKQDSHLGYEIYSSTNGKDFKLAGWTYSSSFVDTNYYGVTPSYKVLAVNRYFYASPFSEIKSENDGEVTGNRVCRVEEQYFDDISSAINYATSNQTIYLLSDCKVNGNYIVRPIKIAVDPSVHNDIYISNLKDSSYLIVQADLEIIGNSDARIIFDGKFMKSSNPPLYNTSHKITLDNVIIENFSTSFLAGAIYSPDGDLDLKNCTIKNCNAANHIGTINAGKTLTIDNCAFENNYMDVHIGDLNKLTLKNISHELCLDFNEDDFGDYKEIQVLGVNISQTIQNIKLFKNGYMLNFVDDHIRVSPKSVNFKFTINNETFEENILGDEFTFGKENHTYNLGENQYLKYTDKKSQNSFITGETIKLSEDMEFDVEIKNKLELNLYLDGKIKAIFLPENCDFYLPQFDDAGNRIISYKDEENEYFSGDIINISNDCKLIANYLGKFSYSYYDGDEFLEVKFGIYGENIELRTLDKNEFAGWATNDNFYTNSLTLKSDLKLFAVYKGESEIYILNLAQIVFKEDEYFYTGSEILPEFDVYINGVIIDPSQYLKTFRNNIDVGTRGEVRITGISGISTGTKIAYFTIKPRSLNSNNITISGLKNYVYNGSVTSQTLNISYQNINLILGRDYDITYLNDRIRAGDVNFEIKFKGNFSGSLNLSYKIDKAPKPQVNTTLKATNSAKTLADITLPTDFVWKDESIKIEGNRMTAVAIYNGEDKENYEQLEITFEIIINVEEEKVEEEKTEPHDNNAVVVLVIIGIVLIFTSSLIVFFIIRHKRNSRWE